MAKKKKKKHRTNELPEKFLERLVAITGPALYEGIRQTFHTRPATFRINTILGKKEDVVAALRQEGFRFERVEWYNGAFILRNKSKRELTELPVYKQGKIYIQSLASMVPPLVLDPKPGEKILDLTAAPGSKTSQIAALMSRVGELVANDMNKVRFFKLKHNMEMLGVTHLSSQGEDTSPRDLLNESESSLKDSPLRRLADHRNDNIQNWTFTLRMEDGSLLSKEYPGYFDKILLDAPCSAETRFIEGDPKSYGFWKEAKIKNVAYRQQKLLFAAWNMLAPGGSLVYSTCTFAPEENEMLINKLLERVGDEAHVEDIPTFQGLKTLSPIQEWKGKVVSPHMNKALRILPTKDVEGFFVVKVRKKK